MQKKNGKPLNDGATNSQGRSTNIDTQIPCEFISLREAFNLIGTRKFGDDWIEVSKYDKSIADQNFVYKRLIYALQSYENSAYYEAIDSYPKQFDPIQAAGEFFQIDIENNAAYFAIFDPGNPAIIGLSRTKFIAWLHSTTGAPPKKTSSARGQCVMWLEEMMRSNSVPFTKKEEFKNHAQSKFPALSGNQFNKAWQEVVKQEEFATWGKSGRKANR